MTRRQIARGFVELMQEKGQKEAIKQLAALLIQSKKISELELVLEEVRAELEQSMGHVSAVVTTAHPLSSSLEKQVVNMIKDMTKASSVDIENVIDEDVVGGFIARTSEFTIDASVRGKLAQLKGVNL